MNEQNTKKLLQQFFNLYKNSTEQRFRDRAEQYNLKSDIILSQIKRKELSDSELKISFKFEILKIRTYQISLILISSSDLSLEINKYNCTCEHALTGKICEHITASISYIFEEIKTNKDIEELFYFQKELKSLSSINDIHTLLHSMSKKEIINFIYSIEQTDKTFFDQFKLKILNIN